jgi:hypothetical protein
VLTTKTPPSNIINKNTENFTTELSLFPIKGKNIDLSFTGDLISSDGGLLLLREDEAFSQDQVLKYFSQIKKETS